MIKAYIFDLFGTLAYHIGEEEIRELVGDNHEHLLITKFEDSQLSKEKKNEILKLYNKFDIYLYGDSENVIKDLKKNHKIGIISNIYEITAEKLRKKFEYFLNNFDIITFSFDVGLMKPNPEIFIHSLDKLGIKAKEAIMVGDKLKKDIIPAQQLGMKTILINREKQKLEDLI